LRAMPKPIVDITTSEQVHSCAQQALIGQILSEFPTSFVLYQSVLTQCRIKEKLKSGELIVAGDEWPIFLYQGEQYNPEDPWNGLFRNPVLVSVSADSSSSWSGSSGSDPGVQAYLYFSEFSR
jgi:hypothetical protein